MNRLEQVLASFGGCLEGILDLERLEVRKSSVRGPVEVMPKHLSPHRRLNCATVATLTGSARESGFLSFLPDGAPCFAAVELKTNFIGAVRNHFICWEVHRVHAGSTTQVWNTEIRIEKAGRITVLLRCMPTLLHRNNGGLI